MSAVERATPVTPPDEWYERDGAVHVSRTPEMPLSQEDGDRPWVESARCRGEDVNVFVSKSESRVMAGAAKLVCAKCVVKEPCLQYAVRNDIDVGVWGGLDSRERRALKTRL